MYLNGKFYRRKEIVEAILYDGSPECRKNIMIEMGSRRCSVLDDGTTIMYAGRDESVTIPVGHYVLYNLYKGEYDSLSPYDFNRRYAEIDELPSYLQEE